MFDVSKKTAVSATNMAMTASGIAPLCGPGLQKKHFLAFPYTATRFLERRMIIKEITPEDLKFLVLQQNPMWTGCRLKAGEPFDQGSY